MNISINANGEMSNTVEEYWFAENIGMISFLTANADSSISTKVITNYNLN